MKQKHLYSLLDSSYVTIVVQFDSGRSGHSGPQTYTYKAPKDAGVAVDDFVVVDTPRNGLVIVKVVGVHQMPQIDLDASYEYKWIVQKVDRTDYDARVERERKFGEMMLEVERVNQREKLMNDMRANLPEGSEARKLFDSATNLIEGSATVVEAAAE